MPTEDNPLFGQDDLARILNEIYEEIDHGEKLIEIDSLPDGALDTSQIDMPDLSNYIPELEETPEVPYQRPIIIYEDSVDGKLKARDRDENLVELKTTDGKSIRLSKPGNKQTEKSEDKHNNEDRVDNRFEIMDLGEDGKEKKDS